MGARDYCPNGHAIAHSANAAHFDAYRQQQLNADAFIHADDDTCAAYSDSVKNPCAICHSDCDIDHDAVTDDYGKEHTDTALVAQQYRVTATTSTRVPNRVGVVVSPQPFDTYTSPCGSRYSPRYSAPSTGTICFISPGI